MTLRLSPWQLAECSALHPRWPDIRDRLCKVQLSYKDHREPGLGPNPFMDLGSQVYVTPDGRVTQNLSHDDRNSQDLSSLSTYLTLTLPELSTESIDNLVWAKYWYSQESGNITAQALLYGVEVFVKVYPMPENAQNFENEKAAYTSFLNAYTTWPKCLPRCYGSRTGVTLPFSDRSTQEYAILVMEFINGTALTTELTTEPVATKALWALHVAHTALVLQMDIELRHFIIRSDDDRLAKNGTVYSTHDGTNELSFDQISDVGDVVLVDFDCSASGRKGGVVAWHLEDEIKEMWEILVENMQTMPSVVHVRDDIQKPVTMLDYDR